MGDFCLQELIICRFSFSNCVGQVTYAAQDSREILLSELYRQTRLQKTQIAAVTVNNKKDEKQLLSASFLRISYAQHPTGIPKSGIPTKILVTYYKI